jgi:hypothetical protein
MIFTTRRNSGPNGVGTEQSKALADVRESEARRSLATRGITNVWFLRGQHTATQNVLHSLETVGHGESLKEIVRRCSYAICLLGVQRCSPITNCGSLSRVA